MEPAAAVESRKRSGEARDIHPSSASSPCSSHGEELKEYQTTTNSSGTCSDASSAASSAGSSGDVGGYLAKKRKSGSEAQQLNQNGVSSGGSFSVNSGLHVDDLLMRPTRHSPPNEIRHAPFQLFEAHQPLPSADSIAYLLNGQEFSMLGDRPWRTSEEFMQTRAAMSSQNSAESVAYGQGYFGTYGQGSHSSFVNGTSSHPQQLYTPNNSGILVGGSGMIGGNMTAGIRQLAAVQSSRDSPAESQDNLLRHSFTRVGLALKVAHTMLLEGETSAATVDDSRANTGRERAKKLASAFAWIRVMNNFTIDGDDLMCNFDELVNMGYRVLGCCPGGSSSRCKKALQNAYREFMAPFAPSASAIRVANAVSNGHDFRLSKLLVHPFGRRLFGSDEFWERFATSGTTGQYSSSASAASMVLASSMAGYTKVSTQQGYARCPERAGVESTSSQQYATPHRTSNSGSSDFDSRMIWVPSGNRSPPSMCFDPMARQQPPVHGSHDIPLAVAYNTQSLAFSRIPPSSMKIEKLQQPSGGSSVGQVAAPTSLPIATNGFIYQ